MANFVLIVEDNSDMRNTLKDFLISKGMKVRAVASAEDGIDAIDENEFDCAVIDINLPGKSGFSLIEYIREQGQTMPLVAMTARDGIDDKLRGFDVGLTDYIVKPFDIKELHARLLVHLKNKGKVDEEKINIGKFSINPKSMQFRYSGEKIILTNLEFRIMHHLLVNYGTIVDVDDLIEKAWGESNNMINPPIRIHIANLRKKLDDNSYNIIRTIPGKGYILESSEE